MKLRSLIFSAVVFCLSGSAKADTLEVMLSPHQACYWKESFHGLRSKDSVRYFVPAKQSVWAKCWFSNKEEYRQLIKRLKEVGRFERDRPEYSREEKARIRYSEKVILQQLSETMDWEKKKKAKRVWLRSYISSTTGELINEYAWVKNPQACNRMHFIKKACGGPDHFNAESASLYAIMPELIRVSNEGDLNSLQEYAIKGLWDTHPRFADGAKYVKMVPEEDHDFAEAW